MNPFLLAFAAAAQAVPPAMPSPPAPMSPRLVVAPPIVRAYSPLSRLSPASLAKAQALALAIDAEADARDKAAYGRWQAPREVFAQALRASPPDFARILKAARDFDTAAGLKDRNNERWVALSQSLPPTDQAAILEALPAPRGQLLVPSAFSPPPAPPKSPEDAARDAVKAAARAKIDAAFTADEANRKARVERVAQARAALVALLEKDRLDAVAIERAMDRLVDAQAAHSKAQGQVLAKALGTLTPPERAALKGVLGMTTMIAMMAR